mmetsp:Transcript_23609/g.59278  ORF Transcript_23609/g.59278 Transcript_23609/m.59278 type:complete len:81 (-) Transcript_23609:1265-1507(-)
MLRTDGSGEFIGAEIQKFFSDKDIKHQLSNPDEQFQNGIAESAVGKLTRYMRLFLLQSNLEHQFWGYAVKHAVDPSSLEH